MASHTTGPALLKGCLPVWIKVASGQDYEGEYWDKIQEVRWLKRDGTPGAKVSDKLLAEAEKADPCFCSMLEGFWDDWHYSRDNKEAEHD